MLTLPSRACWRLRCYARGDARWRVLRGATLTATYADLAAFATIAAAIAAYLIRRAMPLLRHAVFFDMPYAADTPMLTRRYYHTRRDDARQPPLRCYAAMLLFRYRCCLLPYARYYAATRAV